MFDDIHFLSNIFLMSVTFKCLHSLGSGRDHLRKASCPPQESADRAALVRHIFA